MSESALDSAKCGVCSGWSRKMRLERANHVRWMRTWAKGYSSWIRQSAQAQKASLAAVRRKHAALKRVLRKASGKKMVQEWNAQRVPAVFRVLKTYQLKLRALTRRQGRALRMAARRHILARRRYRAAQLRRRALHVSKHRRRMSRLRSTRRRKRRRRWTRQPRWGGKKLNRVRLLRKLRALRARHGRWL